MLVHLGKGLSLILVGVLLIGCASTQRRNTLGLEDEAVSLDGTLSNTFVPAEQPSAIKARLRVSADGLAASERPPINLALVVDTSGSMMGDPIEDARAASLALVEMLSDGDRLAVVTFDSTTNVLVEMTELRRRSRNEVREQIAAMEARGTTDLRGGLQAGLQQVLALGHRNEINRIVLLSDGVPNDATDIENQARAAGQNNVAITALGLGLEYDETLLGMIAQASGGRFHYLETSSEVASVFREEVLRLERVIGRNAVVVVRPGPGVAIENVVGQQVAQDSQGVRLSIGDLVEGESRDYYVQFAVEGRRSGAVVELFDAVLSFDDALESSGRLERRLFLGARSTDSEEELAAGRNEEVEAGAAQIQAAAVTVEAIRVARSGEVERAREMLRSGAAELDRAGGAPGVAADFAADDMVELAESLPAAEADADAPADVAEESRGRRRYRRRAPAAAPAATERMVRGVHEQAMETLLGQKA